MCTQPLSCGHHSQIDCDSARVLIFLLQNSSSHFNAGVMLSFFFLLLLIYIYFFIFYFFKPNSKRMNTACVPI